MGRGERRGGRRGGGRRRGGRRSGSSGASALFLASQYAMTGQGLLIPVEYCTVQPNVGSNVGESHDKGRCSSTYQQVH